MQRGLDEAAEDIDLNSSPGAPEADNDPVRIYLREMGATPLLTREGEVDHAKLIECGQLSALKALSRLPIVMREVLAMGADLKRDRRSIREIVTFDEEDISEEILRNRIKEVTRCIDQVQKHYKAASRLTGQMATRPGGQEGAQRQSPGERITPRDRSNLSSHPQTQSYQF